jgi:glycosyltransferase involved in cell wall biosynthesis
MPKVTVLTPTYNGAQFIGETVKSIQAQTFKDWEYIIVDDGSTDGTLTILDKMASNDARIKVVRRDKNGGLTWPPTLASG